MARSTPHPPGTPHGSAWKKEGGAIKRTAARGMERGQRGRERAKDIFGNPFYWTPVLSNINKRSCTTYEHICILFGERHGTMRVSQEQEQKRDRERSRRAERGSSCEPLQPRERRTWFPSSIHTETQREERTESSSPLENSSSFRGFQNLPVERSPAAPFKCI